MVQSETTQIFINNKDLGFWTQQEITAQRFELIDGDPELCWCNHAGAIQETVHNQIDRIDEPDICWTSTILVCDKCPAWRKEYEPYWEDAPYEGVFYGY